MVLNVLQSRCGLRGVENVNVYILWKHGVLFWLVLHTDVKARISYIRCSSCIVGPLVLPLCTSIVSLYQCCHQYICYTLVYFVNFAAWCFWHWDTIYSLDQTLTDLWNENNPRKLKPDGEDGDSQCHVDTATKQYCLFIALIHKIWAMDEQSHDAIIVSHVLYSALYLVLAVDDCPVPLPLDTQAYCKFHFIKQIFWTKMKWFFHIAFFWTCLEALCLS